MIDTKERKKIVRFVAQYCIANFPKNIESSSFKLALSNIMIELFPCFKTEVGPYFGADSFYNPETKTGYLVNALKYRQRDEEKTEQDAEEPSKKKRKCSKKNEKATKADIEEKLEELCSLVLPGEEERVQALLKETSQIRKSLIEKDPNLYKDFPFYFIDAEMVSHFSFISCFKVN